MPAVTLVHMTVAYYGHDGEGYMPDAAGMTRKVVLELPVQERALGGVPSSTTTTDEATPTGFVTSTTSDNPFFTAGASEGTGTGTGDPNDPGSLTKTALEWVFAIAALLTVTSFILWRYSRMRRRFLTRRRTTSSQSSDFNRRHLPRTTGLPRFSSSNAHAGAAGVGADLAAFYPPSLTNGRYPFLSEPLPSHIQDHLTGNTRGRDERPGRRAVRGADTDAGGRRGGARDADDVEGGMDDKDVLPAYDTVGSPPQYADGATIVVDGIPLRVIPVPMPHDNIGTRGRRDRSGSPVSTSAEDHTDESLGREPASVEDDSPPYEPPQPAHAAAATRNDSNRASTPSMAMNFHPC